MKARWALVCAALLLVACQGESPELAPLSRRAEALRGRSFLRPVEARSVPPAELKAELRRQAEAQFRSPHWKPAEEAYKAFGLLPADLDLEKALSALLEEQVVGLYDPKAGRLWVAAGAAAAVEARYGRLPGLPEAYSWGNVMVVHELVHALDDQHFDLERFLLEDPRDSDRAGALRCVVEGDATWVMFQDLFDGLKATPEQREAMGGLLASSLAVGREEMGETVPPYLTDSLLIGYLAGHDLVAEAHRRGGSAGVDRLFEHPPRSMEEVLHPEKYFAGDDPPLPIEIPGPAEGQRAARITAGRWGEFDLREILLAWGVEEVRAEEAAAGWGGDAYALYRLEEAGSAFIWDTRWDTEGDAAEFEGALAGVSGLLLLRDGRAVLVRGAARGRPLRGSPRPM